MTSRRKAVVVVCLAVTVLALGLAVIGWGNDGLQAADAVAGVFSLTFAVIAFLSVRSGTPPPAAERQYWNPPPVRSGVGPVLLLGGIGAGLMLLAVVGTVALLVR